VLSVAVGARFSLISQHSCKRIQRLNLRVTSVGMGRGELGVVSSLEFRSNEEYVQTAFHESSGAG
jgi:hypothetical protein